MGVDPFEYLPTRLRTPTIKKLMKYAIVSGIAVVTDVVVFVVSAEVIGLGFMTAHLAAVGIATVPNYLINRAWTWRRNGKNRLWSEVIPFWVMAFLGFLLSTLFVAFAKEQWGTTPAVLAANLSGFGVLWVMKFVVLDKLMWRVVHDLHPEIEPAPASLSAAARRETS